MRINENNFFVAQVVLEIYAKTQVSKTARCVFLLLTALEYTLAASRIRIEFGWQQAERLQSTIEVSHFDLIFSASIKLVEMNTYGCV